MQAAERLGGGCVRAAGGGSRAGRSEHDWRSGCPGSVMGGRE